MGDEAKPGDRAGDPPRKRAAGRQLTKDDEADAEGDEVPSGPMPVADEQTMKQRRVVKARRPKTTGAGGLFAGITTAGPAAAGTGAGFSGFPGFGASSSSSGGGFGGFGGFAAASAPITMGTTPAAKGDEAAAEEPKKAESPFGGLSGSPFGVKPGAFPPIAAVGATGAGSSASPFQQTFPAPDSGQPAFPALPSPFQFGASSSAATPFTFGFGGGMPGTAPAPAAGSAAAGSAGFTFGSQQGDGGAAAAGGSGAPTGSPLGFSEAAAGQNAFAAAAAENQGKEFKGKADEDTAGFQPAAVPAPQSEGSKALEAVRKSGGAAAGAAPAGVSGEEQDEVLCAISPLQLLKADKAGWQERGVGTARVNKPKEGGKSRLIFRREANKLVLNEPLGEGFVLTDVKPGSRTLQFTVMMQQDGGGAPAPQTFVFRLKKGAEGDLCGLHATMKAQIAGIPMALPL